ncbi:MAG: hypothetical protein UR78_C0024G0012 [Candidatus Moranbacteria bacterium GW2011_GWF2_35_39]|nr:MAG: hypothetical protein UR78_C0024G0012 [Candidatus Moranbacteria bacterium GW2011_GWF2_35_39]
MDKIIKIKKCGKIETLDSNKKPNGQVLELFSDRDEFTSDMGGYKGVYQKI